MAEETRKFQVAGFRKTSNVHPDQEYELRLFDMAIAKPGYVGTLFHGTEAEMRAALKESGVPEGRIELLFAQA